MSHTYTHARITIILIKTRYYYRKIANFEFCEKYKILNFIEINLRRRAYKREDVNSILPLKNERDARDVSLE